MDIERILLLSSGIWLLTVLVTAARAKARPKGWLGVVFFITASCGLVAWLTPAWLPWVAFALTVLLVATPGLMARWSMLLAVRQQYGRARWVMRAGAWLHPFDGWPSNVRYLDALWHASCGRLDQALEHLRQIPARSALARRAVATVCQLGGRWDDLLAWIDTNYGDEVADVAPDLLSYEVRARGEVGDLGGMVDALVRYVASAPPEDVGLAQARLFAHAFAGDVATVDALLDSVLAMLPRSSRVFWRATAELAAGSSEARDVLARVLPNPDPLTRAAMSRRAAVPLANPSTLDRARLETLAMDAEDIQRNAAYLLGRRRRGGRCWRPWATWSATLLNLAAFGVEILTGGSTSSRTLYDLGAMATWRLAEGEWWRALTSMFLHYGASHLAMNLAGLLYLGPFVERGLGWLRFAALYVTSGAFSMLAFAWLTQGPSQAVGASGAVMGLVGARVVMAQRAARGGVPVARRQLVILLLIVAMQVLVDLSTPQISFTAHAGGFVMGALIAAIWGKRA